MTSQPRSRASAPTCATARRFPTPPPPPARVGRGTRGGPRRSGEGDALRPDELVAQSPTGAAQQRARRAVRSPHAGADLGAAETGCGEEKRLAVGLLKAGQGRAELPAVLPAKRGRLGRVRHA